MTRALFTTQLQGYYEHINESSLLIDFPIVDTSYNFSFCGNMFFYAIFDLQDAVLLHPSKVQVARASNIIHAMLQYRRDLDKESLMPVSNCTLVRA